MGFLHYGGGYRFEFDDRTLAHLRTVILGKYTLQESLVLTWIDFGEQRSIWLHPNFPLQFEFDRETTPELDHEWLERLQLLASSPSGLRLVGEQAPDSKAQAPTAGNGSSDAVSEKPAKKISKRSS